MSKLAAILMAILLPATIARAEIVLQYKPIDAANIEPLTKGKVEFKCIRCGQMVRDGIRQKLNNAGYEIVDSDATTKITITSLISLPKDGKAPLEPIEFVYGTNLPLIQPAINGPIDTVEAQKSSGRQLQFDAGALKEARSLTSSSMGAVAIVYGFNLMANLLIGSYEDEKRIPGVVKTIVNINRIDNEKRIFHVYAAANTPETPEALIDASIDAAVQGIVNGIKQGKDGGATPATKNAEQSNIVTATQQQDTQ